MADTLEWVREPDLYVTRDGHPLRPWLVVRHGEPDSRHANEVDAQYRAHRLKYEAAAKVRG